MQPFSYSRAPDTATAIAEVSRRQSAAFLAGGTDLLFLQKDGVEEPAHLVDINALPLTGVELTAEGARIGALARLADVAAEPELGRRYPAVREAILSAASPQLRTMGTVGGNLLQRTRCPYFRAGTYPCNKRAPGSGCSAIGGVNRQHSILGTSERCIASFPSDLPVALLALDAVLQLEGSDGPRTVPLADFYLLPGDTPQRETVLGHAELITSVALPPPPQRSHYLKVRDRASFEIALVSVAVALDLQGGRMRNVRIALGGVAPIPWRAREAEEALEGAAPGEDTSRSAAEAALREATPQGDNAFKIELTKRTLVRALTTLGGAA